MRKIVPLLMSVILLSGCDFFRTLANRPTSADIQRKREFLEAEKASHQARLDAQKLLEQQIADSLKAVDAIRKSKGVLIRSASLDGVAASALPNRFYIVVGAFSKRENAEKLASKATGLGYPATLIAYRNGFTAVGLCGSDNLIEVYDLLQKVRNESFCPGDVWVLENE